MKHWGLYKIVSVVLVVLISGCASTPSEYQDPRDPWESFNRGVYTFNDAVDKTFMVPAAKSWRFITPQVVRTGVTNFFNNIDDIPSALNNLLQFKLERTATSVGRVVVNSTVGLLGVIDVATNLGMAEAQEDFGQTLGYWGIPTGPYLVVPFFGPRNVRDTFGLVVDWYTDPVYWALLDSKDWAWGLRIVRYVNLRENLLSATNILEQAALDPYEFQRDAYLQRRLYEVYDGNPPETEFFDDSPGYEETESR